jgi:hypothetical protein
MINDMFLNYLGKDLLPKLPTSPKDKIILILKYLIRGPEYILDVMEKIKHLNYHVLSL